MTDSGNGAELLTGHQPSSPPGLGSGGGGAPAGDKQATVPLRIVSSDADILALSPTEYLTRWRQQESFVTALERKLAQQEGELTDVKQAADKVRVQLAESQQRERVLMRRLTAKERETQDYLCQLNELKNSQTPTASTLRSTLLDPAVNCVIQQLKCELQATRSKLEDTQNEMAAWKFTPDSNTGKRLMAKCRLLYQENEELGKITSSGRIAKLESDLALQKSFSEEVRKSQQELDSFLADLDEDVEGMQSTIFFLQQELRKAKEAKDMVQKENAALKLQQQQQQHEQQQQQQQANSRSNGDASVVCCEPDTNNVLLLNNNNNNSRSSSSNSNSMMRTDMETDENTAVLVNNQPQTTVVVDDENVENNMMSGSSTGGSCNRTRVKRVRTSSVLSIDYTEDDALVINTNGDVAMSSDHE